VGNRFPPFFLKGLKIMKLPALTARTEFAVALNQICTERGISVDSVLETIQAAILAAYRKDKGIDEELEYEVIVNPETGAARVFKYKKGEKKNKVDVTPPGFGRIAAQTAKQVILQKIREAEKNAILDEYQGKIGQIVNGMVLRFDGTDIICDIGRGQGVMPLSEQVRTERYYLNKRLSFYILDIAQTKKGKQVIVSRAAAQLVSGLFRREVPEVASGAVEIKIVSREPGSRTKVAVVSKQSGVDPVGSCVGQKGVRVQAVIDELGGEKLDIVPYSADPAKFITASLSPASNLKVVIDDKKKEAVVTAPEDQLSLAIGKDGQNVRLAARLTGYKIDIVGPSGKKEKKTPLETKTEKTKKTTKKVVKPTKKQKKEKKVQASSKEGQTKK
jgi:N utilization substance protein A